MKKINQVISKNFKVLLRNKFSLSTMILGPIIIILMLGFLFNNQNSYNITVGLYTPEETQLYNSYLDNLKIDGFNVLTYTAKKSCIEGIRKGLNNLCIIFPENFELKNNHANKINIKIDPSKKNILFITKNLILSSLSSQSQIYQINNTKGLLNAVTISEIESNEIFLINNNLSLISSKLKGNVNLIDKRLVELKSSFKVNSVDFDKLESKTDSLVEYIGDFVNTSKLLSDEVNSYLSNISDLANSDNSTTSDEIRGIVTDAKKDISSLNVKFNSLKYNYNLNSLLSEIGDANSDIESLENSIGLLNEKIDILSKENNNLITEQKEYILKNNHSLNAILNSISKVKITDVDSIVKPVQVNIESEGVGEGNHLNTLIPSLIVSLIFIIAIVLSSNFILMEKENASYFRNFLTKNSSFNFFLGDFISLSIIIFGQILMIVSIYYLLFLKDLSLNLLYLILGIIPIIFVFVLVGMIIGHISNNQATNIILSFLVIFIFFALSGSIFPLELFPLAIKNLVINNPFIISESIVRKLIIFNLSFSDIKFDLLYLGIYTALLFILNIFFESINKRRTVYQYYVAFELRIKNKLKERKSKH